MSFKLVPSIWMEPSQQSVNLKRVCRMVDFPAPVLPTTPTFIPACATKLSPFNDGSMCSRYFMETPLNSTRPLLGHWFFESANTLSSLGFLSSSSDSSYVYWTIFCEDIIKWCTSVMNRTEMEKMTKTSRVICMDIMSNLFSISPLNAMAKADVAIAMYPQTKSIRMPIHRLMEPWQKVLFAELSKARRNYCL